MSGSRRQRVRDERGAVLVAGLLLTVALLIVVGAAVDIGRAFIERRELVSLADGAALSGSQALDLDALHAGRLALAPSEAQATALGVLAASIRVDAAGTGLVRLSILGAALGAAVTTDLAEHRIPNRIVVPASVAC